MLLSQEVGRFRGFLLFCQPLPLILLGLFISLECFDIKIDNVRKGQIFSRFKCQPNDRVMCALDLPNQTISFVTREYCLSTCHTGFRWSWFNHIADEDPTRCMLGECQLYAQQPQNIDQQTRCSLYKSDATSLSLKQIEAICNGFTYIPSVNKYYKPIFKPKFWGEATQLCSDLSLNSHLVIFSNLNEFQQVLNYLSQFPASSIANCSTPAFPFSEYAQFSGYWTAQRRTDVYTKNQATCFSSPLVWIKDNTTSGSLPRQSWETAMWISGEPNCAQNFPFFGMLETCASMALGWQFYLNEVDCWYPHCPLCQIDLE